MNIAKVAVLVNTPQRGQSFDYLIPPEFLHLLEVGAKVTVPFSSRPIHGYILGFASESPYDNLKEVIDVEPEELWLTPNQIQLALWLADYYLVPLATALNTMVPGAFQGALRLYYRLSDSYSDSLVTNLSDQAKEIWQSIMESKGRLSRQELLSRFGVQSSTAINQLTAAGLVVKEYDLSAPALKGKQIKAYLLTEHSGEFPGLTPLQDQIISYLRSQELPAVYQQIREQTGASRSVLKTLVGKGYLRETVVSLARRPLETQGEFNAKQVTLTNQQTRVLEAITTGVTNQKFSEHLLHGVTGSGKTEVYKRAVSAALASGRSALVLVPEISLTPQMAAEFCQGFGQSVAVLHSKMSAGERFDEWNRIKRGVARVVLGARSAIFAPLDNIGLIVIDEEHESSYKQTEAPHYHAVTVARAVAKQHGAVLILGSATPDITTYNRALVGATKLHELKSRVGGGTLPQVSTADMRVELKEGNRGIFSRELKDALNTALDRREQGILFLNRRGYASFMLCRSCGEVIKCRNCQVSMTVHRAKPRLSCHYCDFEMPLPKTCPKCNSTYIRDFGVGTERVEQEVLKHFPRARVARLDGDTTNRKSSLHQVLSRFRQGKVDILVGTQMVAKGLDFPNVTVVGVVAADTSLNLPDYRSAERTFQLVSQVAGRAGRGEKPGRVIIQTYTPDHYSIKAAASHDYQGFYQEELLFRERLKYPPFCDMVLIAISSPQEEAALRAGEALEAQCRAALGPNCAVSPVHPAPFPKLRNRYRFHLILRWLCQDGGVTVADKDKVYELCTQLPSSQREDVRVSIDVDPVSLL